MNLAKFLHVLGILFLVSQLEIYGELRHTLADDPTKAWAQIEKVHEALRPPDQWRTNAPSAEQLVQFQKQVLETATTFADKAREFIQRFPKDENVGDARITVVYVLGHAVAAGDTNAEKQIATFVDSILADKIIPEDERAAILLFSGNVPLMKKAGMRWFTEGKHKFDDEFETAGIESMRAALKQFPTNSFIYTMFVAVAQRSTGARQKAMAEEIVNAPGAPPGAKTLAKHILKGTKPYEIGKPVDVRFTALDGREVDLAKLKGKVVLVEFWSTSCGPCIAGMPNVKAAYERFHDRGFEVVGISLDDKEGALRRFIKEKELPWPQHFDGKAWENQFALRYGIFGIPTMWLIDKKGNLRAADVAHFILERSVTSLLAEQP